MQPFANNDPATRIGDILGIVIALVIVADIAVSLSSALFNL